MNSVVMIGATGAVGTEVVRTLLTMDSVESLTLLGRREFSTLSHSKIVQHLVDPLDPTSYQEYLTGASTAICTLGVGQPSKMSKERFLQIDRDAVLDFGRAVREAGASHFQLLGSVGADPRSPSFYLRSKGQLEDGLRQLGFERLSLFRPSMILTPTNRYGLSQAITLAVWPRLKPLLVGPLHKYRGIPVEDLGRAIALNLATSGKGEETLTWKEMAALSGGAR